MPRVFHRYVAIGDSSTEGLEDPRPEGRHRGWADRLAEHVAAAQREPLHYANLAIRGRKTREVLQEQLAPALAMRPDLASVFAGTNDIIRPQVNLGEVVADLRVMHCALRDAGATVLTITMPDLSALTPIARRIGPRLSEFNDRVRALCAECGTLLLDVASYPEAVDPRLWHEDRLHANSEGHRRIAAGLADVLGLPGFAGEMDAPLPPQAVPTALAQMADNVSWTLRYLLPWVWRRIRGKSSGDDVQPKRPLLTPVQVLSGSA